jgi:hypothetical protein
MFPISTYWPRMNSQLKRRWWYETRYGKDEPTKDLQLAIETYVNVTACAQSTTEGDGDVAKR